VLPLNDIDIPSIHKLEYKAEEPSNGRYVYYPGTAQVPEASAAPTLGRSFKILAQVTTQNDTKGVLVAQGSRFGGYSMFIKDGKLHYIYNFLGIPPEQELVADLPAAGDHVFGVAFNKDSITRKNEAVGKMKLYIDDKLVTEVPFRIQSGHYALTGEGLCIGYDSEDAVSKSYPYRFPFSGGLIHKVVFDVGKDAYLDVEHEFKVKLKSE